MKLLNTLSTAIILYSAFYSIPHAVVNSLGFRKKLDPFISHNFNKKLIKIGYLQFLLVFLLVFSGVLLQHQSIPLFFISLFSLGFCLHFHCLQFYETTFLDSLKKTMSNFIHLFIDNSFIYKLVLMISLSAPMLLSIMISYYDSLPYSLDFLSLVIFFCIFSSMLSSGVFFSEYLWHIDQEKAISQSLYLT